MKKLTTESKNRKKVLFVTYEYRENIKGGIGRVINGLCNNAGQDFDIDVLVISDLFDFIFFGTLYTIRDGISTKIKKGPLPGFAEKVLTGNNYSIVHLFYVTHQVLDIIKFIRERDLKVKIVYSCHSLTAFDIDVRNGYSDILPVEKYIYQNSDHIHALHAGVRSLIHKYYPEVKAAKEVTIIPNGVQMLYRGDAGPEEKGPVGFAKNQNKERIYTVLCISRWSAGKGIEYLADAVPYVLKEIKNVRFIIGGRKKRSWEKGTAAYVKMVDRKIKKYEEYIESPGWLDARQVHKLLLQADIWVMPSQLEYFPYALLEPIIYNVPVISSRFEGVEEIVQEDKECLFYDARNPRELADKIIGLLLDEPGRTRLAQNALHRARTDYSWEKIVSRYNNMYNSCL